MGRDYVYKEAIERIYEVVGFRTQTQLAEFLEIRQSSVSDAKRRRVIPASWLLSLLRKNKINPDWILYGNDSKYLVGANYICEGQEQLNKLLCELSAPALLEELKKRLGEAEKVS